MKIFKITTLAFCLLISQTAIMAQSLEAYAFSGYTFSDNFPINGGRAKIYDGHTFGGGLQYMLNSQYAIEALYQHQKSRIEAKSNFLNVDVDLPMDVHFILVGSNRIQNLGKNASVYGGLKAGAVIYSPKGINLDNVTHFATGISIGGKFNINSNISLKVQSHLYMPITDLGGSIFWSPGSGVNVGLSGLGTILHFGFTGGLSYKLF